MTYVSVHQHHDECLDSNIGGHTQNFIDRLMNGIILQVRFLHRRKHLRTLGEMSNQQLSDIGLERSDLHEASKLGRSIDVTSHLAQVVRQRRQISRFKSRN